MCLVISRLCLKGLRREATLSEARAHTVGMECVIIRLVITHHWQDDFSTGVPSEKKTGTGINKGSNPG